MKSKKQGHTDLSADEEQTLDVVETEGMEIDHEGGFLLESGKSFSLPGFLRKVFMAELGDDGRDHKLLVIAVHVVLLESGFVGFDPVSNVVVSGFHFRGQWPSSSFRMPLAYTLPEIISQGIDQVNEYGAVQLKFQSIGKLLNVSGSLVKGSDTHWVQLNEEQFVPVLNVVWTICGSAYLNYEFLEREVFEFWRTVKDELAFPLLIDLREKAGLPSPPCFMCLPTDLKLKILESLHGVDIAKLGRVCSELRCLTSNEDLWKQKFVEQFGDGERSHGGSHWKEKFAKHWKDQKVKKSEQEMYVPRGGEEALFLRGSWFPWMRDVERFWPAIENLFN